MKRLVETLFRRHREALHAEGPRLLELWKERIQERSTSLPDCLFLWLLVREYQPRTIFEIGTFVGTTAAFMAEASGLQAQIHTCDKARVYRQTPRYEGIIEPMPGQHSAPASRTLRKQGLRPDLVFADGRIDWRTARNIAAMMHGSSVFATHDYVAGDKGEHNLRRMERRLRNRGYRALTPTADVYATGYDVGEGLRSQEEARRSSASEGLGGINACTALLLPGSLQDASGT